MQETTAQVPFVIVSSEPYLHLRTRNATVTLNSIRPFIEKASLAASAFPTANQRILYESVNPDLQLSTVDWYEIAGMVAERLPGWRIAMVVGQQYQGSDTAFYEATTQNLGTDLRYFDNLEEGKAWLTGELGS
jgi:hypothetical protein